MDAEVRFLSDFAARNLISEGVAGQDSLRMAELFRKYHDLSLGTVHAWVVAAAERLGLVQIATLDRGHFTAVDQLTYPFSSYFRSLAAGHILWTEKHFGGQRRGLNRGIGDRSGE